MNVEITVPSDRSQSQNDLKEMDATFQTFKEISSDMKLIKFNHATPVSNDRRLTALFFDKTLALKNSFTKPNPDQTSTSIEAIGNDSQPDFLRYIVSDEASHGFVGKGNVHHIAMAVEEDEDQLQDHEPVEQPGNTQLRDH